MVDKFVYSQWPDVSAWFRGGFALLLIFGALLAAVIFLLTKPPAYARISEEVRPWMGLLLLAVPIAFAIKEIDEVFFKSGSDPHAVPIQRSAATSAGVSSRPAKKKR